jgi:hypothetical protein
MRFFIRLFAIATIFLLASSANANHVLGGNLTWDCLGGNQYQITMRIYKDCFGASPALSAENLFVFPTGCTLNPQNITLNLISTTEISNLCASELPSSSCVGGLSPGTQLLTYQATVTLTPGCTWEVIWNEGDWNYFNNINYSTLPDAYLDALINTNYCADSPVITSIQVPYVCRNNGTFVHTPTVTLPAGVTASYTLSTPQTTGASLDVGINVPGYVNTLGATVNATTGAVSINTNGIAVGNYIVTVQITLTQGGNAVGTLYENMVFVIRDCAITPTTFANPEIQSINIPANLAGPATINACSGDSVCFTVSASNTNLYRAITITSTWSAGLNAGTPVFAQSTVNYNPASATFCFTAQPSMVGVAQTINFNAIDNACTAPQSDAQVVTVNVFPSVTLNPTTATICNNAAVTVTASGGTTYTWSVLSGDATPGFDGNAAVQVLESISGNTVIMVSMPGVPAQCNATDTLTVTVPDFTLQPLTTQSMCVGGTVTPLTFTLVGVTGTPTYQWYSNATNSNTGGTAIAGATAITYTPSSATAGTTYYYCLVTLTSASCPDITTNTAEVIVVADPTITTQPLATQNICIGGTGTLSVIYSNGLGNATYQWYSNTTNSNTGGSIIAGATSSTYTTPVLNTAGTRNYYCIVTLSGSGCGTAISAVGQVIVGVDPTISTQPLTTQSICVSGTPTAISVAYINGSGTPAYQWYSNTTTSTTTGTAIPGATSATYTFPQMNTPGTFYYYCVITLSGSGCNVITSATSQVIVVADATIATQPQASQTVCLNGIPNALTVTVNNGLGTISYQWYCTTANNNFSGSALAGATSPTFIPPTNVVGTRYYYCRVNVASLTCGVIFVVTSGTGAIIVVPLPTVNTQPTPTQSICIGGTPNALTMGYTGGTGTASYQWYSNTTNSNTGGTAIAGATTNSYTPPGATIGTSYYYGVVTLTGLGCGSVASNVATVNVIADPLITTQPTALQTLCVGGIPSSLTTAYSGGTGTASYQWFSNTTNSTTGGTLIAGATTATYTPAAINTSGNYYYYGAVTLSGSGCGTITSSTSNIVVVDDPSFSVQPLSTQTVCLSGTTTALSVTSIGGTGTMSYQWFSNATNATTGGTAIAGATATTYTPPSAALGTIYYYCEVSATGSGCGTAASATAAVVVVSPPTVSTQPTVTQTICDGGTATALSVAYTGGTGTPSYQWYSNATNSTIGGTSIAGATASTYTPTGVAAGTSYYYCIITLSGSACGTATSNTATVIAVADPTITTQPTATQTICAGGTPSALTIAYSNGTGTASYQWYSNTTSATTGGTLIAGATAASYSPPVLNTAGSFYYYGIATLSGSGCGAATSAIALVTVIADPIVSTQPIITQTLCAGGIPTPLTVASTGGTGTPSYQWYSNAANSTTGGTLIAGATAVSYSPVTTAVGTIYYYGIITLSGSGCVSPASSTGAVIVVSPPTVSTQPTVTQTICDGGTATALSVAYTGGTGTPSYQWYSNATNSTTGGTSIAGATASTYTPTGLAAGTSYYYCIITLSGSACGTATSNTATVIAVADPSITTQPTATQTICAGGTPSALPLAYSNGTGTPSYQWYSNTTSATTGGTLIAGATAASYSPPVLNTAGSFYYYGIATLSGSGCGAATSASAEVIVVADPTISVQPLATQTNCQNGISTPLTVTVTGGVGTTTYQWYTNIVNSTVGGVASGNAATLTPLTAVVGTAYVYCIINTSGAGCSAATSATAEVIVAPIPSITTQPQATQTVCQNGTTSTLSFAYSNGSGATTYQWYSNPTNSATGGTAVAGETNATFTPSATAIGTTYYYCVSTLSLGGSGCGTVTTQTAAVIVVGPPTISTQPTATQTICVGGTPSALSIAYTGGTGTASYQWYSNTSNATTGGAAIVGATTASFTPPTLNTSASYFYYGTVTLNGSGCGSATSASSEVVVVVDPTISVQPLTTQTVCQNGIPTQITVTVTGGTGTTTYQWYTTILNNNVGGVASGNAATLTPITAVVGTGYVYCVVNTSGAGCTAVASTTSAVIVVPLPTISSQPIASQTICQNGVATPLTFTYTNGTGTPTYQWYVNATASTTGGSILAGETNVSFAPPTSALGSLYYYCVATISGNGCGTVTTQSSEINVVGLPTITAQPLATQTICSGGSPSSLTLTFSGGTGAATYQWYSNSTNATTGGALIPGGTAAQYNIPNLNTSGSYYYYGIITLGGVGCGSITTSASEVIVNPDPTVGTQPLTTQSLCATGTPTNLQVSFNNGAGVASYQWYSSTTNSTASGILIPAATNAVYTPSSTTPGTQYYYCTISLSGSGCADATSSVGEVIVFAQPTFSVQPNPNETVCLGGTPTTFSPTVAGGTGAANYQWYSNSTNTNTGGTAVAGETNLTYTPPATTVGSTYYYLTATFAGTSCGTASSSTSQIIVVADPTVSTQPLATDSMCVGGIPNTLNVAATGGTGTPTYQWYSNTTNSNVGGTVIGAAVASTYNPTASSTAGTQFFYAQITLSGSGCDILSSSVSEIVNVADPIISTQPIASQDVCLNGTPTNISAAVSGGLGTVSYAWYSNSTQTLPGTVYPGANTATVTPTNTPAGISYYYMVATLSGNGCNAATSNFSQVTVHALPTVTATPLDNSICFGTTTDIVASGATSYVWTAAPTITSPANVATVSVAPIGSVTYTVQGTDAFGCVNTATATVVAATQLNVQENITTNICYQTCTGAIALTPTGSGSSYTVAWNTPGVTGLNPQNLCPGNYTYTVTDNLTCSFQNTVNIAALPNNPLDNVIITQPTCFGYNNGSIDFQDASAVSFQLVNAATNATIATQPGGLFGTIGAGNYNIIYNDALGCVYDSLNFSIVAQSAQITLALNAQAPVLCFNQVVPLTAIAGGGDGGAITVTWGSCNTVTNCILGSGNPYNYTLTSDVTLYAQATDATGCASVIQSIALNLANPVQVNLQNGTSSVLICEGDCVNMSAVATGGNNPINIEWYEVPTAVGGATIGPNGTTNTICPTVSTSVFVFANDGCGVPDYDTLNIVVQSFPTVSFSVNTQDGCLPLTVSFTNNTSPTFNGNCLWSMDDGTTFANCGNQVYTYTDEGAYTPTLYVISPEGCSTTYSLPAPIVVHGYPVADFSWAPQPVDVTNPVVQFTDASVDAVNYLWEFAWLGASDLQNPVFTFPDEDLAEYPVCLTVENSFGCQDTMCRTIRLNSVLQVWVPNAFTPEQDGLNEVFVPVIKGAKPETYHFSIFDRWGTLVFESFEIGEPWIGDVRNGNAFAANGAYIWRLEVQPLEDRSLKLYTGFVTVIR